MIEQKLSTCIRQLRDHFAPFCVTGAELPADVVRDVVASLTVFATCAERLEGATVPKAAGQIIELKDYTVARVVPVVMAGEVS